MNTKKEFLGLVSKLLLFYLFIFSHAHARFMVEPFFKQYKGDYQRGQEDGSISGNVYGLNLGYLGDYFMAGMTFENGQYQSDDSLNSNGYEEYRGGGIGTFMGFHFWDSIKIWTGYLNSSLEPTDNDDFRYFGQHVSFGLGYRIYDGLMLNVEGFRNQYTQQENDVNGKTEGLETNIKTEGLSYFLSYILVF